MLEKEKELQKKMELEEQERQFAANERKLEKKAKKKSRKISEEISGEKIKSDKEIEKPYQKIAEIFESMGLSFIVQNTFLHCFPIPQKGRTKSKSLPSRLRRVHY